MFFDVAQQVSVPIPRGDHGRNVSKAHGKTIERDDIEMIQRLPHFKFAAKALDKLCQKAIQTNSDRRNSLLPCLGQDGQNRKFVEGI